MNGRNGVTTKFNHDEPLEYFFDLEFYNPEMIAYLSSVAGKIDIKQEIIPVNVFGHKIIRPIVGSSGARVFFEQGQREEALMFLLRFSDKIIRHNLGKYAENFL